MSKEAVNILGFEPNERFIIEKKLLEHKINIKSYNKRYKLLYTELKDVGFNDNEIKKILIQEPRIIYCIGNIKSRLNNMKDKILTGEASDLNIIPRAVIFTEDTLNNKYKTLINLGFKNNEIKNILKKDPKFITRSAKTISESFNFFLNIGMPKQKIIKIFLEHSKDIAKNSSSLKENFKNIVEFGFALEEASKLISNLPSISFNSKEKLEKCFLFYEKLGQEREETKKKILSYTSLVLIKEENYMQIRKDLLEKKLEEATVNKITLKASEITTYNKNVINYLYETFRKFGLKNEQINEIIRKNPEILYHKIEKIEDILNLLVSFNISKEDLIKITTNHPMIFESSIESLKEKFSLIFKLDLYESILKNPKNLIQGCEKTYLRYMYIFNELEKEIDLSNDRLIFASKPNGIPETNELKTMYSYIQYKDNDINKRLKEAEENNIKIKCFN